MDTAISRAEHEEFMRRMEDEHKRIHHRISDVEETVKEIHGLAASVERLAASVEQMAQVQRSHTEQIDRLESRDGEMWRKVVGYAATAVVGIVIGYIFTQIGM